MRSRPSVSIATVAVPATLGLVAVVLLLSRRASASVRELPRAPLLRADPPQNPKVADPETGSPETPPTVRIGTAEPADEPVAWYGGTGSDNREAIGWMLASENPHSGRLVWFLQALTANNVARARARLGIHSIREMLQSGVRNGHMEQGLGWGAQYDKETHVTRFASTSAALKRKGPPPQIAAFVEEIFLGLIDPADLRGAAGEKPPPRDEWGSITSYLQHKNFDQVVAAQLGHKGKTEAQVVESWGHPRLLADVEGVRFYGRPRTQKKTEPVPG